MNKRCCTTSLLLFVLASGVLVGHQKAFAQLGKPESEHSIVLDQQVLETKVGSVTIRPRYSIRELAASRYMVREYVSNSGVTFAIAWNGQTIPNLTYLLGSYYPEYQKALQESIKQQPPLTKPFREVKTGNISVQHWGLPRNFKGRAFAPALFPEGVDINEIK
jgi:hypothetical protein